MMEGHIGVDSQEGVGSTFWFTVVLKKQPESPREAPALAALEGTHMLVVDDNATNRDVLGRMLARWGVRFEEAASRDEALALAQDAAERGDPYRVAILDMQMPNADGESLGCEIKGMPKLAPTELVMMSSVGRRGDAARLAEEGFAAYLVKPVKRSELHDSLATVLGAGRSGAPASRRLVTRHSVREDRRRRVRVLVAEDNVSNQQVAMGVLGKLGFHADAVANGEEALAALATAPYDLVLMDVHMPEMDGLQATRRIRDATSSVADHRVPIVAMTASATKEDRERCLAAGMDDFMSKPITPDRLADVLSRWVEDEREDEPTREDVQDGQPEVPEDAAVFDRSGFVERLLGDETLAARILSRYVEDIPHQIAVLKEHLSAGNGDGAIHQAHTIKGAAASVGAPRLQAAAFEVEQASRNADLAGASKLCPALEARFEEFRQSVEDAGGPSSAD
jgi:CheY-like chemotaxis protein/HPt (histidine-containing phosphotransfer) domain-containing protein